MLPGSNANLLWSLVKKGRAYWIAMAFLLAPAFLWGQPSPLAADLPVIASDGFESNPFSGGDSWLAPWSISGAASVVPAKDPHSGAKHFWLRSAAVALRTVDLAPWTDVELAFWAKAESFESADIVTLEVSADGSSWLVLEIWDDGDDDKQYHLYDFDLSTMPMSDNFFLRFKSQMNEPSDYFFVDQVQLSGEPALVGPPAPEPALAVAPSASPASTANIAIDGVFSDWVGYPNLGDPLGDADKAWGDLAAFYWANNGRAEVNYWMIERYPVGDEKEDNEEDGDGRQPKKVKYTIYIDTDNNGIFTEEEDRRVMVDYKPRNNSSDVRVRVKRGSGGMTVSSTKGDWGESGAEGGQRVEFQVSWDDLGITRGDVIRMYAESNRNDRIPDSGDIQWSSATVLGYWILGILLTGSALTFWYIRGTRERTCRFGER